MYVTNFILAPLNNPGKPENQEENPKTGLPEHLFYYAIIV